jgi:hypothetical protein
MCKFISFLTLVSSWGFFMDFASLQLVKEFGDRLMPAPVSMIFYPSTSDDGSITVG